MRFLTLTLACALSACAGSNGPPPPPPPPVTTLLGMHVSPSTMAQVLATEAPLGRKLDIVKWFPGFPPWGSTVIPLARQLVASGRIPMLALEPRIGTTGCAALSDVSAGRYLSQLTAMAVSLNSLGALVWVELFPEMTQSAMLCANPTMSPSVYIAAYRYVAGIIHANASNVKLVWSPGQPAFDSGIWPKWFPGPDVVDYSGEHIYNSTHIQEPFSAEICKLPTLAGKPTVIGETGAQGEADQLAWLGNVRAACPNLYAFVYFDAGNPTYNYILTPPAIAAFKTIGS